MIINETYDKSLWLMLCSNSVYREKIVEFFNSVPMELYDKLRISLGFYVSKEMNFSINRYDEFYKSFLTGEVKTSGDMRYWYMIDPKTGALSFGESVIDEEDEYGLFHMVLYPIDNKLLLNNREYNDFLIGEIIDEYSFNEVNDKINFHLIRFSLCDLLVSSCKTGLYNENKYRLVDLNKMPDEYNLSNLVSENSVKKLIRGKKNSR